MKQVNVLLLFLFAAFNTYGTSIYIDYNASKDCMDSYEYAKDGNEETPYLFFHLKVSDNEKIILEAGEDYTPRQYKPAGTETCAELERDEKFVDEVNKGTLEVFLVQEHTYGFRIYKVKKAEYYYNTNIAFGTRSDNYSFSYYYNQASTGNLATKGSTADVYFSEKDDNDCLSRYKFRIKTDPSRNSMADLTILPEIGILYKKSDPMPPLAVGEKLELRKINNYNIVDYLGLICKFYGGQPKTDTSTTSTNNPGDLSANNTNTTPLNPSNNTNPIINTPNGGVNVTGGTSGGGLLSGGSTSTGGYTSTVYPGAGRIYLDLDKGYYVDSHTGERAEGDFGGNSYSNGYMINKNTGTTSTPSTGTTNPDSPANPTTDDSGCLEVSTNDTHIVQKKETLYTIARTYGLDIKDVKKWNKIGANNRIYPCMRLVIVPPVEQPSKGAGTADCLEQPTYNTHVVQKRETLYSIAATYGVTVNQIKAWNGLQRDAIYPCTRLMIQPPSDYQIIRKVPTQSTGTTYYIQPQTAPATVTPATQPQSYAYIGAKGAKYHTVAKRETLFRIAAVYGLKVVELKRINGLTSDMIKPGQVLLINEAVAGTQVIQVPTQQQAVPQDYVYINPALAGNRTAQGQPLVTGKGDELIEMNVDGTQRLIHIVQDEDTLHSIAQKYKTTVGQLRSLNDMDRNEVIVPFQRLYVR